MHGRQPVDAAARVRCDAVSVDGEELHSFESKSVASDGWYSLGQSAGPNAPFDIPFYFIM